MVIKAGFTLGCNNHNNQYGMIASTDWDLNLGMDYSDTIYNYVDIQT